MALIECGECGVEVSDKAAACVKCGAPVAGAAEVRAAGAALNTIQETSKKFKLQTLASVSMIIIGSVMIYSRAPYGALGVPATPVLLVVIGLVWYVVNRFRIWWHHK